MNKSNEPDAETEFALRADDVHVWTVDLRSFGCDTFRQILSPDELQISQSYRFAKDRDAFIARRIARRQILSRYAGQSPDELTFESGVWGKPQISGSSASRGIEFNASSSRDLAVIAVSHLVPLGVDVEFEDSQVDFLSVAAGFCGEADLRDLHALPAAAQSRAFYRLWTQTEALGKAQGHGLSQELPCDMPDFRSQLNTSSVAESVVCRTHEKWWLQPLELNATGYMATLCTGTVRCRVRYFDHRPFP